MKYLKILGYLFGIAIVSLLYFLPDLFFPAGLTYGFAIAVYTKVCSKNVAGCTAIYWCEIANITSFTITSGEISAVTPATGKKFLKAGGDIDTIKRIQTGVGTPGGANISYTHRVEVAFSKPSTALNTLLNALADASPCGIYAIVTDGNGTSWLVGYNATDGNKRPLRLVQDNVDSGFSPAEDANKHLLALETVSGYVCLPFDSSLSAAILGGTATAFITYS